MINKLERLYNIAMVNIELLELEMSDEKVQSEAGRYITEDSLPIRDDGIQFEEPEQDILGLTRTGD